MRVKIKTQTILKNSILKAQENYKGVDEHKITRGYLESRIAHIKRTWAQFEENHVSICTGDEKFQEAIQKYLDSDLYSEVEIAYFELVGELQDKLNGSLSEPNAEHNTKSETRADVNLPRIDLPKFNGEYSNWRAFHDMFVSLIHTDQRIPLVQKLHYLKSCVTGEAERLLKQFDMVASNYYSAWEVLTQRYNNKRVQVSAHLKLLVNQPAIKTESEREIKGILDTTREQLHELKALGINTTHWDPMVIFMIVQKLPEKTRNLWEQKISDSTDMPSLEELFKFLESRFRTLEAISDFKFSKGNQMPNKKTATYYVSGPLNCIMCNANHTLQTCTQFQRKHVTERRNILINKGMCLRCFQDHGRNICPALAKCALCNDDHPLFKCTKFLQKSFAEKQNIIQRGKLCSNCLGPHNKRVCTSNNKCFKCGQQHHTTLHDDGLVTKTKPNNNARGEFVRSDTNSKSSSDTTNCHYNRNATQSLLATAMVIVENDQGLSVPLRALIDLGSQSSFISESAYQLLRLKGIPTSLRVTGLGSAKVAKSTKEASIHVKSTINPAFTLPVEVYVIKRIAQISPPNSTSQVDWSYIQDLQLADPKFTEAGHIDVLLGVNVYSRILRDGLRVGTDRTPVAQNTHLGWIIFGELPQLTLKQSVTNLSAFTVNEEPNIQALNQQMRKFWEIEEITAGRKHTAEEVECEMFYDKTCIRLDSGQYQVRIPFHDSKEPELGDSKRQALFRFLQLEKKLARNAELSTEYSRCIEEYITLGHMTAINADETNISRYFMPHHAVVKDSTTTKVRVVFDASMKTTNGRSLNEQMLNGPTLQPKLSSTLLKWRKHKFAITADIEKMYRMINLHPADRRYQTILWRDKESKQIQQYELNTVTFGTTSAPYLAIKTLQKLALDDQHKYPSAAQATLQDFYVDDLLTGADTLEGAKGLQRELIALLKGGGFNLRKWAANHNELLITIPAEHREVQLPLSLAEENQIKALGIYWHPATDHFAYTIKLEEFNKEAHTKRRILSEVSKLYDPLGWISPSVILAKGLIQKLWMASCSWDERAPNEITNQWADFKMQLPDLAKIKIARWVHTGSTCKEMQIHGFCDASSQAYAAVAYLRVVDEDNIVHVNLLAAKTRVAPIKAMSTPRLELCGAVLLSRLIKQIKQDMHLKDTPSFSWTDSKVTLAWINGHPNKWRTFIANRVVEIHENSSNNTWNFIPTKENPADVASRGIMPAHLRMHELWWKGPQWLQEDHANWPKKEQQDLHTTLEAKQTQRVVLTTHLTDNEDIIGKYSSFTKLVRVIAYCRRFIQNSRNKAGRLTQYLTTEELRHAIAAIIRLVQQQVFNEEYKQLQRGRVTNNNKLLKLSPFMAKDGTIRAGGRLHNANVTYDRKHPMILPKQHHLTNLIIDKYHLDTLHGGAQLTLNTIRNQFWIINGLVAVKGRIFKCVKCTRFRIKQPSQLMGQLPTVRVTPARPFENTGVDFAGPIQLRMSKHRGSKVYKGYLCIFICMATKAIHLEVVSDLTAEAFVAAFRRFTGRRGICRNVYSDNGTNFIGAEKILKQNLKKALQEGTNIINSTIEATTWHFIPPSAPHFGGLWEAGVKSVKHHLKRITSNTTLTFEELETLLIQIEACLNSRPLHSLPSENMEVLTPGHFLIGTTLLAPPEPRNAMENITCTDRWKHIQKLRQQFWNKWSKEYISQLQQRQKWLRQSPNPQVGQVVLLKDDKTPPIKWPLGVIENVHPGSDGIVRVVTLRTTAGTLQRPINKICPLPVETT